MGRAVAGFKHRLLSSAAVAIALPLVSAPAFAATTVTASDANVLNLLSPFLSLNSSAAGQTTLTANLNGTIVTNNTAAASGVYAAEAISEKSIFSGASGSITLSNSLASYYGAAANLAGGLPTQAIQNGIAFSGSGNLTSTAANGTIAGYQSWGGLGALGAAYQTAVSPYAVTSAASNGAYVVTTSTATPNPLLTGSYQTQNIVKLLSSAYSFNSTDLGVAKFYFANGTTNGTSAAVAPTGYTLPVSNGLPIAGSSVYDTAYGVNTTETNQNVYGDSRPVQVAADSIKQFDPSAITGLTTNPAFPSGHTTYAYTDSILIGMMAPQFFQSMVLAGSEYANSRIALGVHYPLDIIASRSFVQYNLMQLLSATAATGSTQATNPYYYTNANGSTTVLNLNGQFVAAAQSLNAYLNTQTGGCGGSLTACAASNPYNAYSTSTYSSQGATDAAIYQYRMTYGLPTYSYAQAPRELTDTQGYTAAILLSTLYGGQGDAQAQALANAVTGGTSGAGVYGSLTTSTINQIIENTEGQALQAFYGSQLSYWSRINLYDAAGYFSGVTGYLDMAASDQLNIPVTIASGGVLAANGSLTGAATVQSGGTLGGVGAITGAVSVLSGATLAPGGFSSTGTPVSSGTLTINGSLAMNAGSTYHVTVDSAGASLANVSGSAAIGGSAAVANFSLGSTVSKQYTILTAGNGVTGTFSGLTSTGLSGGLTDALSYDSKNAYLVMSIDPTKAGAISSNQKAVVGGLNAAFAAYGKLPTDFATLSGAALTLADGEAGAFSHDVIANVAGDFVKSFFNGGLSDPAAPGGHEGAQIATYYAEPKLPTRKGPALDAIPAPFAPYWTAWGQGFGFAERIDGDATKGSQDTSERAVAGMAGFEYRGSLDTAVGFGFGGGAANYSLANGLGSGRYDFGQIGAYVTHDFARGLYATVAVAGGAGAVKTDRPDPTGAALHASFDAADIVGRVEVGQRLSGPFGTLVPYGAFQYANIHTPDYAETGGRFALDYAQQDISRPVSELGLRLSRSFVIGDGAVMTLGGQAAWAHDFLPRQFADVSFVALPAAQFSVNAASPSADTALLSAGGKLSFAHGLSLEARLESQIGGNVASLGGRGTISYSW